MPAPMIYLSADRENDTARFMSGPTPISPDESIATTVENWRHYLQTVRPRQPVNVLTYFDNTLGDWRPIAELEG